MRADLRNYGARKPQREVMRWYGPYLIQQAQTFALVAQRWRSVGLCSLPKEVVHWIIGYLREMEFASH
jgi:hypothetical protein